MSWRLFDPDDIAKIVQAQRRRDLAEQAAAGVTAQAARHIGDIWRAYPWMAPGAVLSLGKAGASWGTIEKAADAAARIRANSPGGFTPRGTRIRAGQLVNGRPSRATPGAISGPAAAVDPDATTPNQLVEDVRAAYRDGDPTRILNPSTLRRRIIAAARSQRPRTALERRVFVTDIARDVMDVVREEQALLPGRARLGVESARAEAEGFDVMEVVRQAGEDARRGPGGVVKMGYGFADVVKPLSRDVQAAMNVPYQATQGLVRRAYSNIAEGDWGGLATSSLAGVMPGGAFFEMTRPEDAEIGGEADQKASILGQTDFGIMTERAIESMDLREGFVEGAGEGFFVAPDSAIGRERWERERAYGTIGGHNITAGRALANTIGLDVDSRPFTLVSGLTDASLAVAGPGEKITDTLTAAAGLKLLKFAPGEEIAGGARFADELTRAGGRHGLTRTVDPVAVGRYLDSADGTRLTEALANTSDTYSIWRASGRRWDPQLVTRIADTADPVEVRRILEGELGVGATTLPRTNQGVLLGNPVNEFSYKRGPGRLLSELPSRHIDTLDTAQAMRTVEDYLVNVRMPDRVPEYVDRMARAASPEDTFVVTRDLMDDTFQHLLGEGVDPQLARRLSRMYTDTLADDARGFIDETGDAVPTWTKTTIDGERVDVPGAHLLAEHIGRYIPLPDARNLRRATANKAVRFALSNKNGGLRWGPSLLLGIQEDIWKPAVLARFAWPLRVVGEEQLRLAATGFTSVFSHPIQHLALVTGRKGALDATGTAFDELEGFREAMARGSLGFRDIPDAYRTRHFAVYGKGDDHFLEAWADELATLRADPVAREAAGSSFDEMSEWFWSGDGAQYRKRLADAHPGDLTSRAQADAYLDTVFQRLQTKTGGNGELLEAIHRGRLGKADIFVAGSPLIDPRFVKNLESYLDDAPDAAKGPRFVTVPTRGVVAGWNRGVERLFGALMSKPTNTLSRSPAFRQFYWQRIEELAPMMDDATRGAAAQAARNAKLGDVADRIQTAAPRVDVDRLDDLADVDTLAKAHALDETRNLLYDLSRKTQVLDSMRLVAPFGEAWKEVLTRWARLAVERPIVMRRVGQVVQGAEDVGFFHRDSNGELVYTIPFSGQINEAITGVPLPLNGPVKGLNVALQIMPGLGPVMQIPVSWLSQHWFEGPRWDGIREALLPYGEFEDWSDLKTWAPPWVQKLFTGGLVPQTKRNPEEQRQYMATVNHTVQYLVSTGRYDASSPEEINRLLEDANDKASWLYGLRAAAQAAAPSAPSPDWRIRVKDGRLIAWSKLRDDYQKFLDDDPLTADEKFLDKWGTDTYMVMQGFTISESYAVVTKRAERWIRDHPSLAEDFSDVVGFFAPQGGEFDYQVYERGIEQGKRAPLEPEEFIALANDMLGRYLYEQQKSKVEGRTDVYARQWLADWREKLRREYPGFMETENIGRTDSPESLIDDLQRAAEDPTLRDTEAGRALVEYLRHRDQAAQQAREMGLTSGVSTTSARFDETRDWLRQWGERLVEKYPDFGLLWTRVFDRELAIDSEEIEEAA